MAEWVTVPGSPLKGPKGDPGSDANVDAHEAETDPHPQYATDDEVVKLTGGQSIQGYKLFTQGIGVAAPSQTNSAIRNDDSRLANARTPTTHASSHATGGSDALTPGDIGAATAGHTHDVAPYSGSYASTITPNCNNGYDQRYTLTGNPTIALATNPTDGQYLLLWFYASGADRTVTMNSSYELSQSVPGRAFTIPSGTWGSVLMRRRGTTWVLMAMMPQTLAQPPGQCVARFSSTSGQTGTTTNTTQSSATKVAELSVSVTAGRLYRIEAVAAMSGPANSTGVLQVNYTTDGSTPTAASTRMLWNAVDCSPTSGLPVDAGATARYPALASTTVKLCLSFCSVSGGAVRLAAEAGRPIEIVVTDLGADPGASGTRF